MSKIKKIIRYHASWCKPCHVFEKTFNEAKQDEKYKDIEFKSVDIESDEGLEECEKYGIKNIPTTIFLGENDMFLGKTIGNVPLDKFKNDIDNANQ